MGIPKYLRNRLSRPSISKSKKVHNNDHNDDHDINNISIVPTLRTTIMQTLMSPITRVTTNTTSAMQILTASYKCAIVFVKNKRSKTHDSSVRSSNQTSIRHSITNQQTCY